MYMLRCKTCGEREPCAGPSRSKLCRKCQHEQRMDRQCNRRHLQAGLVSTKGKPLMCKCRQCAKPFTPKRTTARFCSAKCRVYYHRG